MLRTKPYWHPTRFVLWGARHGKVQIGGSVWHSLAEFRRLGWVPGRLRTRRSGW